MNYTELMLIGIGGLGILCHNLVKMNSLNKRANGNFNYAQYIALEKFSIILSIIVVIAASILSQEIKDLANAGKYLGFGMFTVGYFAQSILVTAMGKAQKHLDKKDTDN
jgi:hypothetical protein